MAWPSLFAVVDSSGNDSSLVWFIVGILAIIALLIYIIGRFPHR